MKFYKKNTSKKSMLNSSILKKASLLFIGAVFLMSCDKDFNEIGSGLVGEDHFDFEKDSLFTLTAFTRKSGAVETTNLPINPLGIFDNGKLGKTTANFVTQVLLGTESPTLNQVTDQITSVVLEVPYFSTFTETDSEGANKYKLDSIYGNLNQSIKLSVYENGYYLRDFDPATDFGTQKYYSDQNAMFDAAKLGATPSGAPVANGMPLNDNVAQPNENQAFRFSDTEQDALDENGGEGTKVTPRMRLHLNKEYFHKRIFQTASSNLVNNNVFKNYFRGLYFKVEENEAPGAMALLNFAQGKITITYDSGAAGTTVTEKKLVLNFAGGKSVSLLTHTATTASSEYEIAAGNSSSGDAKVFLKGGEGAVAYIDLFGGGNSAELDQLRNTAAANKWLVNEAHIVFNVDESAMMNMAEPKRVYLYDATNRKSLVDYNFDTSPNNALPKYAKTRYDGIAQLTGNSGASNRRVKKYRIRVTEHIKNVLFKDSTNIRLGLSVTESIANVVNSAVKTPTADLKSVPSASVLSPLGTIIHGSNLPDIDPKKMRLVISFTKPD